MKRGNKIDLCKIKDEIIKRCVVDYNPLNLYLEFDTPVDSEHSLRCQNTFYNLRYNFLKKHIQAPSKLIEIGDVNGFFIDNFGNRESLSINIKDFSKRVKNRFLIQNINNGIELNERFDYGIMFETLEHLHNPLLILNQILEICDNGVFISIPNTDKTNTKLDLDGGHVFEFSYKDFNRILQHYNIGVVDYSQAFVIKSDLVTKLLQLYLNLKWSEYDTFFGMFRSFQLYYIKRGKLLKG